MPTLWRIEQDLAIKQPYQWDADNVVADKLWASPLGQQTRALEAVALTPFLRRLHGDVILWAGSDIDSVNGVNGCMVRHSLFLQQQTCAAHPQFPSLGAQLEALPFKSNSVAGMVLHHALESTDDPRIALREVTRVLTPGGRVIICGYNPLSLIGVRRLYARMLDDVLSDRRLINPLRLFDWLTLLGFELDIKPLYTGYGLPFKRLHQKFDLPQLERWERHVEPPTTLPFGALLIVSATKQALSTRHPRRLRKERHRLAPVAYPSVSRWQNTKP